MKIKVREWLAMRPVERYMEIQRAYVATQRKHKKPIG